ncbi:MAG: hypothetical protein ACI87N_000256 [Flavobacteriales bacterium]|jgi:hypothetical protein
MNKLKIQNRYIPISLFFVALFSVVFSMQELTGLPVTNAVFWFPAQMMILFYFFKAKKYFFDKKQNKIMIWVKLYLVWNVFSIIRGVFIAETYWDWKTLTTNGFALLLPIACYAATNISIVQSSFNFYLKFTLPLFLGFAFLINTDAYGFYLVPISFLILFLPVIKTPWKWGVLAIGLFTILADLTARSNVIRFVVPMAMCFLYYFRFIVSTKIYEVIRKLFFITPLLFLFLAVNFDFNVFKMNEYIKGNYTEMRTDGSGNKVEDDLIADSRSFMYAEALLTANYYNSWLIGRSPARGVISESFGDSDLNKRGERTSNEMAIANVFNWTGIIGVILYFMVFYKASYLAINRSNSIFSKIMGIFIAFRWVYAWVEDANYFNLTYFILWFMLGICYSSSFRKMNDREVKAWVAGIFEKKKRLPGKMINKSYY